MAAGGQLRSGRRTPSTDLSIIGWREWVSLPDLGIGAIKVKIDTGALSSALHASDLEFLGTGIRKRVRFKVHPYQRDRRRTVVAEALFRGERRVRSSSGDVDRRPVIRTTLEIGGQRWSIELTLAQRDNMGFRMLLGRSAIQGRYLLDPGRSFLLGGRPG
jgi:hypothetical protein